jgi:hypothetical protein
LTEPGVLRAQEAPTLIGCFQLFVTLKLPEEGSAGPVATPMFPA